MKLENGQVLFSSYTQWKELNEWLKKKSKRLVIGAKHTIIDSGQLSLPVEDIIKNPPRPRYYTCTYEYDNFKQIQYYLWPGLTSIK